jgi:alginate O-acetyltransferase complex protein AlgI
LLFSTYTFLVFLLVVLAVGGSLQTKRSSILVWWLIVASLTFYAKWNYWYLALLMGSMVFNYAIGNAIAATRSRAVFAIGIIADIGLLGWFKYANWISTNLSSVGLWGEPSHIILPLAISFFTFEQISYLIDCRKGRIRPATITEYAFFVTFFPKLIAGPIVRFSELQPQIARMRIDLTSLSAGLTLFVIGLGKKLLVADYMVQFVTPVFDSAKIGREVGTVDAWLGVLSYTFQLYFDFSGYSDMAVALSLMFGLSLPLNFYSPYKATSIIEFWRRWHMTLSRFLRDYIYFPLGGSRRGPMRRYINLFVVMTLGGLWHGAGSTFIIWGALHGFYLGVNHAFRAVAADWRPTSIAAQLGWRFAAWGLTFVAVVIGWVFFRAEGLHAAAHLLSAMFAPKLGQPAVDQQIAMVAIAGALALALLAPNSNQIMGRQVLGAAVTESKLVDAPKWIVWRPSPSWAALAGVALFAAITGMSSPRPFLYFTF